MLLFKQKAHKDIVFWYTFPSFAALATTFLIVVAAAINGEFVSGIILFLFVDFVYLLFALPLILIHIEVYEIYDDKIVSLSPFGMTNSVMIKNVRDVRLVNQCINGGRASVYIDFYVIDDGRKSIDPKSTYSHNKKKYNFMIYKTDEIEKFLRDKNLIV